MNNGRIKVLCVDDNADITGLLNMTIRQQPDMESVGYLHETDRLVEQVGRLAPDVVLLDISMPGCDPLQAIGEIAKAAPNSRVIVFSGHDDNDTVDSAVAAGAWGYVAKHQGLDQVLEAIRKVAAGNIALNE